MKNSKADSVSEASSDVVDIKSLSVKAHVTKLEEQIKFITKQNVGYSQTVDQLLQRIEEKDNIIRHLESMVQNLAPVIGEASPLIVSDEEYILELVIKDLKASAQLRTLTKDEMTKLDLAIKNKRLIQGNATTIDGKAKTVEGLSKQQLIQIASKPLKLE